jgi:hypothetical protein
MGRVDLQAADPGVEQALRLRRGILRVIGVDGAEGEEAVGRLFGSTSPPRR